MWDRSISSGVLALILMMGGVAGAGLFNPPLKNPSFELPSLGAGHTNTRSNSITSWIIDAQNNIYLDGEVRYLVGDR
jgi:hypothetical protein